ncbi:MAG: hypothetical protein CMG57_05205 [Candidatus Marinimicrobia bacterium]|nr:hypothetical protein [Candidatus Neomarinimicrobiota bacterium]
MKKIMKVVILIILIFSAIFPAMLYLNPNFGSNPSNYQKAGFANFKNYDNGKFQNLEKFEMMTGEISIFEFFKKDTSRKPKKELKQEPIQIQEFCKTGSKRLKFSWLGHSAFILNINNKIILLDPMFGKYASPIPIPSLKRYSSGIPFSIDELTSIDAVIFSHDHYDHLDYSTIKQIKNKVKKFYVPHGLGNHLKRWGVNDHKIHELNWNQAIKHDDIEFVCLPALHFSGRGPFNRNSTLWASWAIKSPYGNVYFGGDSGYGKHFVDIGQQHGPFNFSFLDCGQYNGSWKYSHMVPEESVQASIDLNSNYFIPIHWAGFTLALHSWTEPVERSLKHAEKLNQKILTPKLGQIVTLHNEMNDYNSNWWRGI